MQKINSKAKLPGYIIYSPLLVFVALISTVSANDSEKWFLMSRHGECAEIKSLHRKIPDIDDIDDIEDPKSFTLFMEGKGHKVISNELKETQGKAFQVDIPEKGLSLIFVKSTMCKEFTSK